MPTLRVIFLVLMNIRISHNPLAIKAAPDLSSMSLIALYFGSQNFRRIQRSQPWKQKLLLKLAVAVNCFQPLIQLT